MDNTSNERTVNNVMRHEYMARAICEARVLGEDEKAHMKTLKDMGLQFFEYCDAVGQSRELSLAKTKIEEAVMWAVKHVSK